MISKKSSNIKHHIKKEDLVQVIAGNDKYKKGKVKAIHTRTHRAIVEGVNIRTFHIKPAQKEPKGKRQKREAPIHISNLMLIDPRSQTPTRIGRKRNQKGKLQRYAKKTGHWIPS